MEKYFSYVPLPLAIGINFIGGIVLAQAVGVFPILGLILGIPAIIGILAVNYIIYRFCKYANTDTEKDISPARAYVYGIGIIIMVIFTANFFIRII